MNRRAFVQLSLVGAATLSVPLLTCKSRNPAMKNPLAFPVFLAGICDDKTIHAIGETYLKQLPDGFSKNALEKLLLTDISGNILQPSSPKSLLFEMLDRKTHNDFEKEDTVFVKGWVLSKTEACQCVFFVLTSK
ncbi:MAG: hypothetical protein JST87_08390 [Bacteroidetes bacterium]|nr:hypothetical protein [Bacteroidota bacterium]MBS1933284.1 hypothetical protein [Bacteroidota bacterium]